MATIRKLVATKLSSDFRAATAIVTEPRKGLADGEVFVRTHFAGVNASDINYTAGHYLPGVQPPFDTGFESIGVVAEVGKGVKNVVVGQAVAVIGYGAFSEGQILPEKRVLPLPSPSPTFLPLLVSGLTASVALDEVGELGPSTKTVLVTAAAGGTGQFAVQLAHLAGAHVIGTCSSEAKGEYLKSLGCNRVVNYKKENLFNVLKQEYPKGVDLVYESVGGEMFDVCVNNLAVKGKLIVIGSISGYKDQSSWKGAKGGGRPLSSKLLAKSASIRGFFLNHYSSVWQQHTAKLAQLVGEGKLKSGVDPTSFKGLERVADAVDHMYEGKNMGKVVVDLRPQSKL